MTAPITWGIDVQYKYHSLNSGALGGVLCDKRKVVKVVAGTPVPEECCATCLGNVQRWAAGQSASTLTSLNVPQAGVPSTVREIK